MEILQTINGIDLIFLTVGAATMFACCLPAMRQARDERYTDDDLARAYQRGWLAGWRSHRTLRDAIGDLTREGRL